ncbi:hypothetical protein IV102_10100 [bacterium]|nr:hypothetical protein [bacterium]
MSALSGAVQSVIRCGRAVGTLATGVVLGSLVGLGVAGYSSAAITPGCAALGGTVAYFKS